MSWQVTFRGRTCASLRCCGSQKACVRGKRWRFVSFVLVYEALRRRRKERDAFSYLLAACAVAVVSLLFLFAFGIGPDTDIYHISAILALYAAGAFWFAWREKFVAFTWAGTVLLFFTAAQVCHSLLAVRFPWQASSLFFAVACTAGALGMRQL